MTQFAANTSKIANAANTSFPVWFGAKGSSKACTETDDVGRQLFNLAEVRPLGLCLKAA
jgi:hypothetical protein